MSRKYKDPFDLFEELIREMEEEIERFEREFMRVGTEEGTKVYGPYVYGFRITVGPDGKPKIQEFGNVKNYKGKSIISEEREPLVDVIEKGDEVRIISEVPGVNKDQIKVRVNGNKVTIQAQGEDRKYYKEVELPSEVDEKSAKATYNNGVLQIILKKKPKQETGTEVKIE